MITATAWPRDAAQPRPAPGTRDLPPRHPTGAKVMLFTLSERTSARGTEYLSGWLGRCKLIGFRAKEPDKYGNPMWEVYAQEPEPREEGKP